LRSRGALVNNARVPSNAGKPIIGVDVGGTKVAAAEVVGQRAHSLVEHPTDLRGADELLAGIEKTVREVVGDRGAPAAIGVGVPSQIDYATGTVVSSVNIPLVGVPLKDELRKRLGAPVFVDNDANLAGLAEAYYAEGTPEGEPIGNVVMYTLGTGVGGGIVIGGRIFRGATGLGAELGHVVIDKNGPECPGKCPNHGCLEAFCSGTALGRDARTLAEQKPDSALGRRLKQNGHVSGRDVVAEARDGDPDSLAMLETYAVNLGVGISNAINAFEPQLVVIGGGLSQAADLFLDRAWEEARSRALPALFETVRVSVARAGPHAGVIGAGLLAFQESGRTVDTPGLTASERVR
jgi:glucokinase